MSQDAINASAQNAVVAINSLNKYINSISTSLIASSATLVDIDNTLIDIDHKQFGTTNTSPVVGPAAIPLVQTSAYVGAGNLVRFSIINSGSTQGYIYDKAAIGATTEFLCGLPNTIGIYEVHLRFSLGIVIEPGVDQIVLVSYSPD